MRRLCALLLAWMSVPAVAMTEQRALPADEPVSGVSRALADWRSAHYRDVRYALQLELLPPFERVVGSVQIDVTLGAQPVDVILDWRSEAHENALRALRVNRKPLVPVPYFAQHLRIPRERLQPGRNRIEIGFETPVRSSGAALTRYRDNQDGSLYVYSLLVPADASSVFPCFDQPDLKARFTLALTVPSHWHAVSNTAQISGARRSGLAHYRFAQSEPISTYLFAFAAGPWAELRDPHSDLRLLVRQTQRARAQAEAEAVFRLQREGLRWLERYFARPYPYGKLDVVLLPELAYAGMEHAGAIFLREDSVLFPFEPSDADQLRRAQLVFHETAHQWFGNLVTMRWFDDLWLKEGFANLMAAKAAAALLPERGAWNAFRALKSAAYRTDETRGSVSIWQALPNLNAAKSAYGSIVYSKAPAILRQLEFYLGAERFAAGVRAFLAAHEHGAADWADLVTAFEAVSGEDLGDWARAWVTGMGVPRVRVDWEADQNGRLRRLRLTQSDAPRPMQVQLLLAYPDGSQSLHPVRLGPAAAIDVPAVVGRPVPSFAYANHGDYGYGLFLLDPHSRQYLLAHLGEVQDALLRALLWDALWEEVRETRLPVVDWLALALRELPGERDDVTAAGLLARLQTALRWYLSDTQRRRFSAAGEAMLREGMLNAPTASLRIHHFRTFAAVAASDSGRAVLKRLLSGELALAEVRLSAADRFRILRRLLMVADPEAERLLEVEAQRDPGEDVRRFAFAAGAARPNAETKHRYFEAFLQDEALPERWIEEALPAFNAVEHGAVTRPYLPAALEALPQLQSRHKIFFVNAWLSAFVGGQLDEDALDLTEQVAQDPQLSPALRRKLLEVADELARTLAIRRAASDREGPNDW